MTGVLDAFWRAAAYCIHPKVILWSLLPLVVAGGTTVALGWLYWEPAVDAVRATLARWELLDAFLLWLESIGANGLRAVLAPMLVVALAVPVIVLLCLLLVSWLMTPALVSLVAARRFPTLERRHGARWWRGLVWSLACASTALLALVLSVPLWLVPPLALVLPPLIWGWLAGRVFGFDALADHATTTERHIILRRQRWSLLVMGVVTGFLGAAPSLLWAASAVTLIFAPLLVVVSVWLYTLVFAFAGCWFTHFALAELVRLRAEEDAGAAVSTTDTLPPLQPAPPTPLTLPP